MDNKHTVHIFINRTKYELTHADQTGRSLKELASIPLSDVLFKQQPGEDEVITNDAHLTVKNGDHFHSSPPANYGSADAVVLTDDAAPSPRQLPQPNGWTFVTFDEYSIPPEYIPRVVRLLVKLPPGFPDASPDMFWIHPAARLANGNPPVGTTIESIFGEPWQRFSWHLQPGAWRPGTSDMKDYMRCVRTRFERRN